MPRGMAGSATGFPQAEEDYPRQQDAGTDGDLADPLALAGDEGTGV